MGSGHEGLVWQVLRGNHGLEVVLVLAAALISTCRRQDGLVDGALFRDEEAETIRASASYDRLLTTTTSRYHRAVDRGRARGGLTDQDAHRRVPGAGLRRVLAFDLLASESGQESQLASL